jgi:hypothetical protein
MPHDGLTFQKLPAIIKGIKSKMKIANTLLLSACLTVAACSSGNSAAPNQFAERF